MNTTTPGSICRSIIAVLFAASITPYELSFKVVFARITIGLITKFFLEGCITLNEILEELRKKKE